MEDHTEKTAEQEINPVEKIVSPEIMAEGLAGGVLVGFEMVRDRADNYTTNPLGLNRGPVPQGAVENWVFSHVGDIAEVSLLFGATRVALVGANEVLSRTTGKKIPDEACFWASMITSVAIPSLIELNVIHLSSLSDKFSSTSDPADLFGVGVAAVGIAAAHYASKYREPIKKLAALIGGKFVEGSKFVARKLQESKDKMASVGSGQVSSDQLAKK
ncbi:MAG: hypothetical protein NTV24_02660 [Candidatus Woesebacteria bacterium]|nr:hypothetical protein [Candidatus Woesebacteria bacterium]